MTTQVQDTGTAGKQTRRSDVGVLRITQRDIDGFVLCAEHQGLPYDLLASALRTSESAVKLLVYRWRRAGYVATARLGPGPWWCWLTKEGMSATGLRYPTGRPPLSRLAHIRAVIAARLWLSSGPVWQQGRRGGSPNGGCEPAVRGTLSAMCRTRRSTGPASRAALTPGRCGPSRSS